MGRSAGGARTAAAAYDLGYNGENAPDWVYDLDLVDDYERGKAHEPKPAGAPPPSSPPASPKPAAKRPPASPGRKPPAPGPGTRPSSARPVFSSPKVLRGGTGGGLLLALVLYPVGLSVIKYGAAGPGMWFRAKFLNKTPASSAAAAKPGSTTTRPPPDSPGTHTSNGGVGSTPASLPGQATGTSAGVVNV